MEITEVRVKLMDDSDDRLQAFCSITFDNAFVIRDLKIIDGTNGPFVAMPSRKLTTHCHDCGAKNHMRANYCNQCGKRQSSDRGSREHDGRAKLYADIAHPINSECREMIQSTVIEEFEAELERAKEPDYISRYDDDYDDELDAAPSDKRSSDRLDVEHAKPNAPVADGYTEKEQDQEEDSTASSGRENDATLKGPHRPSRSSRSNPSAKSTNSSTHSDTPSDQENPPQSSGGFGAGIFD